MSRIGTPRRADPRRRRRQARLAGAALLALPLLELALLIVVGRAVGVLATLGLLVTAAAAGVLVLRRVGPAGTALLVPAGLLLIVPGFLSDLAGLVLLVPAVRRGLAARMSEAVTRRMTGSLNLRGACVVPGEVVGPRLALPAPHDERDEPGRE